MSQPITSVRSDVQLMMRHAPGSTRQALGALFALDDRLAQVVRATREPMVVQIRLAWWRDALMRLDVTAPEAEPVLTALAVAALPRGITGVKLAAMVCGWEELIAGDGVIDFEAYAVGRGRRLFELAAAILSDSTDSVGRAGEAWALADLARHLTDASQATAARELSRLAFTAAFAMTWPNSVRALGLLGLIARFDLDERGRAPLVRFAVSMRFRISGR